MLLQPNRKSVKRLRDVLNVAFKHLDEVAAASIMDVCIWTTTARTGACPSLVQGLEQTPHRTSQREDPCKQL